MRAAEPSRESIRPFRRTATSTATLSWRDGDAAVRNGSSASASSTSFCRGFPRKLTYNRRSYFNILVSDQLGIGCDRFNGALPVRTCQDGNLAYTNPSYDFYTVTAPTDPRLPNGGGYTILGLNDIKTTAPAGLPTAQTFMDELNYKWNGVDTNFNWRGPKGIRVQGGTSTGRTQRESCYASLDAPNVRGRAGAEYEAGCRTATPWQTSVKGSVVVHHPEGGRVGVHRVPVSAGHRADCEC